MIKIAVLMSTYNGGEYLMDQIDSIINQSGDFELSLIVRDDGSTDNTQEILNKYSQQQLLHWYQGNNIQPAKSFLELVINNPGYDFYAFSDQDDWWMPDKIINEINLLSKYKIPAIVYTNGEIVDSNLNTIGRNIYKHIPIVNFQTVMINAGVQGCSMLWNKEMQEIMTKGGMPNVAIMHDSYLARVCLAVGGIICYIHNPLLKYRQHNKNVMGIKSSKVDVLKDRIKQIITKDKISISSQAEEIYRIYNSYISNEKMKFIKEVINYKNSLRTKIEIINNRNIYYVSKNMEITMKLKILLGNR